MVKRAGFSLAEVVVALVLLSVGALGVAAGGILALRLLHAAEVDGDVSLRSAYLLDSLIDARATGAGSERNSRYRLDWSALGDSAAVTVRTADSATFTLRAIQ